MKLLLATSALALAATASSASFVDLPTSSAVPVARRLVREAQQAQQTHARAARRAAMPKASVAAVAAKATQNLKDVIALGKKLVRLQCARGGRRGGARGAEDPRFWKKTAVFLRRNLTHPAILPSSPLL